MTLDCSSTVQCTHSHNWLMETQTQLVAGCTQHWLQKHIYKVKAQALLCISLIWGCQLVFDSCRAIFIWRGTYGDNSSLNVTKNTYVDVIQFHVKVDSQPKAIWSGSQNLLSMVKLPWNRLLYEFVWYLSIKWLK